MVIPKNRIRLSRSLHSQVTPYPNAQKLIKRIVLFALVAIVGGFYFFSKDKPETKTDTLPKQILGEQEQAAPKPQFDLYKVKKGDTLFNVSQKVGVSWQTLAEINNLPEPYVLKIGQEIKIPAPDR